MTASLKQCHSALRTLRSQAVVDAQLNFVLNRVLGTTPPELSSFECYLSKSVRTTLAQLRSGHCWLLNFYEARITAGVTDVFQDCGVAPHSLRWTFVPVPCLLNTTDNSSSMGRSRCGGWFSQARRQLTKRGELWAATT